MNQQWYWSPLAAVLQVLVTFQTLQRKEVIFNVLLTFT